MKKLLLASTALALSAGIATAQEVKMGVLLGYTGPIEDITPYMADSAELAMQEISDSGMFLGGTTITPVRADSTCVDSSAAQAAAERLISSDDIVALVGADCSGVTMAVLQNVAMSAGVPMISPSATSPAFTTTESNGMFFRTSPSDARQGVILADIVMERGFDTIALTHTNNDYGSGLPPRFPRPTRRRAAPSPPPSRMKKPRATILPKSARWPPRAATRWSSSATPMAGLHPAHGV